MTGKLNTALPIPDSDSTDRFQSRKVLKLETTRKFVISVAARARAPGFYKEMASPDQTTPPPSAGDAPVNGAELLYSLGHAR
jgi:hypothetical protein